MLYIIDIDDYSFGLSGAGATASDIAITHPKKFYAFSTNAVGSATGGLVSVIHSELEWRLISSRYPSTMTLDGTVYTDANDFVVAFNTLMASTATVNAVVDFTDVTDKLQDIINCVCRDCSSWSIGTVDNASETLSAGTINSCTIIVETGDVTVSNGSESATLTTGQSITFEADNPLDQDIEIDATGGGKAHYVITTCATTTTTTVAPTTTTTTEEVTTTTTEVATTSTTTSEGEPL